MEKQLLAIMTVVSIILTGNQMLQRIPQAKFRFSAYWFKALIGVTSRYIAWLWWLCEPVSFTLPSGHPRCRDSGCNKIWREHLRRVTICEACRTIPIFTMTHHNEDFKSVFFITTTTMSNIQLANITFETWCYKVSDASVKHIFFIIWNAIYGPFSQQISS